MKYLLLAGATSYVRSITNSATWWALFLVVFLPLLASGMALVSEIALN